MSAKLVVYNVTHVSCFIALFYCLLDLSCGEYNVISLYCLCCSVNGPVCLVYRGSDSVCKMFGETIRNISGCGCYFIVMEVLSVGGGTRMCVLCL